MLLVEIGIRDLIRWNTSGEFFYLKDWILRMGAERLGTWNQNPTRLGTNRYNVWAHRIKGIL